MMNRTKRTLTSTLTSIIAAGCISASVVAQDDPATESDSSWISLKGTVTSADADSFMMDYGDGLITVEMDDWDNFGDAYPLADGDKVTVYGRVDKGLYETTTIEAGSVYVDGLNTFFYASAADEEGDYSDYGVWVVDVDATVGDVTYIGTVEWVKPDMNTFAIDTGSLELTVDTSGLLYNPLDDQGFQQIDAGDRVSVDAVIDADFFGDQDLLAESITTLSD